MLVCSVSCHVRQARLACDHQLAAAASNDHFHSQTMHPPSTQAITTYTSTPTHQQKPYNTHLKKTIRRNIPNPMKNTILKLIYQYPHRNPITSNLNTLTFENGNGQGYAKTESFALYLFGQITIIGFRFGAKVAPTIHL